MGGESETPRAMLEFVHGGPTNDIAADISFLLKRVRELSVAQTGGGGAGGAEIEAYNNDANTINFGDPVVLDPAYTTGLGVKLPTGATDPRAFGFVKSASIASGATGTISIGGTTQEVNVTGAVIFGHHLVTSATLHYAQDGGGGSWGPGVLGFALEAKGAGLGTVLALVKPYPLYYALATTIIRTQTKATVPAGNPVSFVDNLISDGSNRLIVAFGMCDVLNFPTTFTFNGDAFTVLQNGSAGNPYVGYLPASDLATANLQGNNSGAGANNLGADVFFNGVNTGAPVGALGTGTGALAAASLVVATTPGDLVLGCLTFRAVGNINARGAGQINLADFLSASPEHMVIDYAIATGISFTFTWTISLATTWYSAGVAIKSL